MDANVIRGWLGDVDLTTTNRSAEINPRAKIEGLRHTEPGGLHVERSGEVHILGLDRPDFVHALGHEGERRIERPSA